MCLGKPFTWPENARERPLMIRSLATKLSLLLVSALAVSAILWQRPPLPSVPEGALVSPEPMTIAITAPPEPEPQQALARTPTTIVDSVPQRARQHETRRPAHKEARSPASESKFDLNRATQRQFEQLPGIGPGLAHQLVAYRTAHGRYTSVEELRAVKGIGAKRYARVAPLVMVSAPPRPGPTRPPEPHTS